MLREVDLEGKGSLNPFLAVGIFVTTGSGRAGKDEFHIYAEGVGKCECFPSTRLERSYSSNQGERKITNSRLAERGLSGDSESPNFFASLGLCVRTKIASYKPGANI